MSGGSVVQEIDRWACVPVCCGEMKADSEVEAVILFYVAVLTCGREP